MDQKRYRRWIILGALAGSVSTIMFAILATQVFATNPAMTPRFTLVAILVILLGVLSSVLLVGAQMCRSIATSREEFGKQRWWRGYAAAVDDLKDTGGNVVSIPASRNGRSH